MAGLIVWTSGAGLSTAEPTGTSGDDGTQQSAQEVARELANPNTPLASLTLRNQYRSYDGDLPRADSQEGFTMLFQQAFPLPLPSGAKIFFRPAIPLLIEQPYLDGSGSNFKSKTGLGDIGFDLSYGMTLESGLLLTAGIISTVPTATSDDLGTEQWTLGPEALLGFLTKDYVVGVFPSHQWDVAGSGNRDVSLTTLQAFAVALPGKGWNIGTNPIINYDWEAEEWTLPLNLSGGRTVILGSRPYRFALEVNYYVERPDAFGPVWMIGLNITPVVKNRIAGWITSKY
jgi:hypothetical protein